MELMMNPKISLLSMAMTALLLGNISHAATQAQAPTSDRNLIIKGGAQDIEIKLSTDPVSSPMLRADGNIEVTCKELENNNCKGIGGSGATGGTGTPPSISFTAPAPDGASIAASAASPVLSWTTSGAQFCRGIGVTGGTVATWTGQNQPAAGSFPLSGLRDSSANKTYTFTLGCYSAPPNVGYRQESRTFTMEKSAAGTGGQDYCNDFYASGLPSGAAPPAGYARVAKNFGDIWLGKTETGVFPPSSSGYTDGFGPGPSANTTQYLTIAVDVPANATLDRGIKINWVEPQGGNTSAADTILLTVSPCPGDFRPSTGAVASPADPWTGGACRFNAPQSVIQLQVWEPGTGLPSYCALPRGKRMYINISSTDFWNGNANRCPLGVSHCGVKLRMQPL